MARKQVIPFELLDFPTKKGRRLDGRVEIRDGAVYLYVDGYGHATAPEGESPIAALAINDGVLELLGFHDWSSDKYRIINLEKAAER